VGWVLVNMANSIFSEILTLLNQEQVTYVVLRDRNLDDDKLSELDILILPENIKQFEQLISPFGFSRRNLAIPAKMIYLAWIHHRFKIFDVHFEMVQDGIEYLDTATVIERRVRDGDGFYHLSREDELLHLFFHNLIGKKYLQEKHLPRIRELIASEPDPEYMDRMIPSLRVREIFHDFLANPERFLKDRVMALRCASTIIRIYSHRSLKTRYRRFYRSYLRRWFMENYGIHVAFMGVDGAGKSTTIQAVQDFLDEAGKVKQTLVYMGPWGQIRSPLLRFVYKHDVFPPKEDWKARFRQKLRGLEPRSYFYIMKKWLFGIVKGWIYYPAVYSELWYRYWKEVRPRIRKNFIVLEDRYVYDLRYIYKKRPMRQFRFWRWFICKFFPTPNLIVFLHNEPHKIVERKPQLDTKEIQLFQQYYQKALKNLPVLSVKTDRSPQEIAHQIVDEMMKHYLGMA